jgi:hypothetical protein
VGFLVVAVLATGCGSMSRDEFSRRILAVRSAASEAHLMAGHIAEDRTKVTFVRVHGGELSQDVGHEQEKVNDAELAPAVQKYEDRFQTLADRIGRTIEDLRTAPQDRRSALSAREDLRRDVSDLDSLLADLGSP